MKPQTTGRQIRVSGGRFGMQAYSVTRKNAVVLARGDLLPDQLLSLENHGAGGGIRTRDPNLGKVVLYQLSYTRLNTVTT